LKTKQEVIIISLIVNNYNLALYMVFSVYAHLNACADQQRCES